MTDETIAMCCDCVHYRSYGSSAVGECRRYPPALLPAAPAEVARFPLVYDSLVCGEYRPNNPAPDGPPAEPPGDEETWSPMTFTLTPWTQEMLADSVPLARAETEPPGDEAPSPTMTFARPFIEALTPVTQEMLADSVRASSPGGTMSESNRIAIRGLYASAMLWSLDRGADGARDRMEEWIDVLAVRAGIDVESASTEPREYWEAMRSDALVRLGSK